MTGPIKPSEIGEAKQKYIPEQMFEASNKRIATSFVDGRATVYQEETVSELVAAGMFRSEIISNGWLNIEEAYRAAGWEVKYDKSAYNETYRAHFIFKKVSKS